jgi:hypothetical protein
MEPGPNPRRLVDDEPAGQRGSADTGAVSVAQRARQAERQQAEERRAAPQVLPILAVEGDRVAAGLRRYRPGVGSSFYSPGMLGTAGTTSRYNAMAEEDLDREIESLDHALHERGPANEHELEVLVHGEFWGPGRFDDALREAIEEGRIRRLSRHRYAPTNGNSGTSREAGARLSR